MTEKTDQSLESILHNGVSEMTLKKEQAEKRVRQLEYSEKNLIEANDEYKQIVANLRAVVRLLGDCLCEVMPKFTEAGNPIMCLAIGQIMHKADDILGGKLSDLLTPAVTKRIETHPAPEPQLDPDTQAAIEHVLKGGKVDVQLSCSNWIPFDEGLGWLRAEAAKGRKFRIRPEIDEETQRAIEHYQGGGKSQINIDGIWYNLPLSESFESIESLAKRGHKFRIKPVAYWSKPEHVPLNCWIRRAGESSDIWLIHSIYSGGVWYGCNSHNMQWKELKKYEHSTDRIHWLPCVVQ